MSGLADLVSKLIDVIVGTVRGRRAREERMRDATVQALQHLRGVRSAPSGDSPEYRDQKHLLGERLNDLLRASASDPEKFERERRTALDIHEAVVIRGERYVDSYVAELEELLGER